MGLKIQDLTADDRRALGEVAVWARQTIAFAISLRDADTRKQFDDPEKVKLAFKEAIHLTDEIWESVDKECTSDTSLTAAIGEYARKVFQWCHHHMNP